MTNWIANSARKLFSLAILFGPLTEVDRRTLQFCGLFGLSILIVCSGVAAFAWFNSHHYGFATEGLAVFAFVMGLILNLGIWIWSVGLLLSHHSQSEHLKEQASQLGRLVSGRQSFDADVSNQLTQMRNYFRGSMKGVDNKFDLHVYVSSPGFGIVGGNKGLSAFVDIIEEFCRISVERAKREQNSNLHLYFWPLDQHASKLGRKCEKNRLPIWENEAQAIEALGHLNRMANSLALFHRYSGYFTRLFQYETEPDELRILILEDGRSDRGALMAMGPLSEEVLDGETKLHSVLIMDDSQTGYKELFDFFKSLRDSIRKRNIVIEDEKVWTNPHRFLEKYFDLEPGSLIP